MLQLSKVTTNKKTNKHEPRITQQHVLWASLSSQHNSFYWELTSSWKDSPCGTWQQSAALRWKDCAYGTSSCSSKTCDQPASKTEHQDFM